jgi:aryl-alcohol dehydrogenase-like predicted oxidoreductase
MIPEQPFGRTGHPSSRVILGGAAFYQVTQAEADHSIDLALSYGVNHFDVAANYGDAELRVGDWIRRHGRTFFLATKTRERTAAGARAEIHRSLDRLQVDHVDLLQLHDTAIPGDWETALGPNGALEAVIEAREQGLARYIGITGHGLAAPTMHQRALERFDFDSVLLPWNYLMAQDQDYQSGFRALVAICQARNVPVQTIKSILHRPWGEAPHTRATWYRPLEDQLAIDRAVHWVLGHPGLFLNSVGDIHVLPRVLDAASRYERPPSEEEMRTQVEELGMQPLFT